MARTHLTLFHAYSVRDDQPERVPVLGGQSFAVAVRSQQRALGREVADPDVGAVAELSPDHHVRHRSGRRVAAQDLGCQHARPADAGHRELRHAVKVGCDLAHRQCLDVIPASLTSVPDSVAPRMRRSQVCGLNAGTGP